MTDLIAIETSAEACSVALHCRGETIEQFELAPMRHAEILLPAVQSLLRQADRSLAQLDLIAFGRGPGSFTSLRIGIGVVQGLAWGAGLPVVPVSSLAAVAQQAAEAATETVSPVWVAMDARMHEVYTASFSWDGAGVVKALGEERVCPPGQLRCPESGDYIAAGNGFERFTELQSMAERATSCQPDAWPRAAMICRLALDWLESNEPLPAAMAQPVYVRNKVASKPAPG